MPYPTSFVFRGHRYTIIRGGSRSFMLEKLAQRRELAPQFLWAIHRDANGQYSLGRRSR